MLYIVKVANWSRQLQIIETEPCDILLAFDRTQVMYLCWLWWPDKNVIFFSSFFLSRGISVAPPTLSL